MIGLLILKQIYYIMKTLKLFLKVYSVFLIPFLFCFSAKPSIAQNTASGSVYVKTEKLIRAKLLLPADYNKDKTYPLIIGMHGFGGNPKEFSHIWDYLKVPQFILVIPEAPYKAFPESNSDGSRYSWGIVERNEELYKQSDLFTMQYVLNVLDHMKKNYKVSKAYLMGFSQGGSYAYLTAIKNPEKFEGIICFGSRIPLSIKYPWFISDEDLKRGQKLKVFIAHGDNDFVQNAKNSYELLKKHAYNAKLFIFEGGHYIEPEALYKALNWFRFSYKKAKPKSP